MLEWLKLINSARRKDRGTKTQTHEPDNDEVRTEFERDFDRILFSTPIRRLGDKTQVFPLDPNESVRTRLTHSHEVSNLARSIGIKIAFKTNIVPAGLEPQRNIPALLAAIGLSHDLGNPPFGHQGEETIRKWFEAQQKKSDIFGSEHKLSEAMKQDFLKFDGNAQTFRLVTRLQILNNDLGMNLTYGTLAALMKYTVPSDKADKTSSNASTKKHGYFQSEAPIVHEVWKETGLGDGLRHPLAYIMEGCDDIAYSVLDTEDAVKKGLVSFSDVIAYLKHKCRTDVTTDKVVTKAEEKAKEYRSLPLSPAELNDVSMQMFRVYAIGAMVKDLTDAFEANVGGILDGSHKEGLIAKSRSVRLCETLKEFSFKHAYKHRSVLKIELEGHDVLTRLMDMFWRAIVDREDSKNVASHRKTPFTRYAYSRISENYRRAFEAPSLMPIRYREAQLLTDMVSGMTDSFAITMLDELKTHYDP